MSVQSDRGHTTSNPRGVHADTCVQFPWENHDAQRLAEPWAADGDMAHPDGAVERTAHVIAQHRASLFMRREYRASRQSLDFGTIRCLTPDVAIADGMWELRAVLLTPGFLGAVRR